MGSKEDIMEATFRALSEYGYADLSIQNIADESEKAKSAIYYHFDDREDLLLSFMDFLQENLEGIHADLESEGMEKLDELIDIALGIEDDERWMVHRALLDLRAQAPRNESFAEKFREIDSAIIKNVEEVMKDIGAEEPEIAAEMFVSTVDGAVSRKVSTGDREGLETLREGIKRIVRDYQCDGN